MIRGNRNFFLLLFSNLSWSGPLAAMYIFVAGVDSKLLSFLLAIATLAIISVISKFGIVIAVGLYNPYDEKRCGVFRLATVFCLWVITVWAAFLPVEGDGNKQTGRSLNERLQDTGERLQDARRVEKVTAVSALLCRA